MTPAGHSAKPTAQKLGLGAGMRAIAVNSPSPYAKLIGGVPSGVVMGRRLSGRFDLVHFFATKRSELRRRLPALRRALEPNGMLWVSWPKKTSCVESELDGNLVRKTVMSCDETLVDVKICAVDDDWSALKFVIRREAR